MGLDADVWGQGLKRHSTTWFYLITQLILELCLVPRRAGLCMQCF